MRYAIVLGAAALITPALAQNYYRRSNIYARGDDLDYYYQLAARDIDDLYYDIYRRAGENGAGTGTGTGATGAQSVAQPQENNLAQGNTPPQGSGPVQGGAPAPPKKKKTHRHKAMSAEEREKRKQEKEAKAALKQQPQGQTSNEAPVSPGGTTPGGTTPGGTTPGGTTPGGNTPGGKPNVAARSYEDEFDFLAARGFFDDQFELWARDPEAEAWADPEADPETGSDYVFDF
jgi:hypothetical protein